MLQVITIPILAVETQQQSENSGRLRGGWGHDQTRHRRRKSHFSRAVGTVVGDVSCATAARCVWPDRYGRRRVVALPPRRGGPGSAIRRPAERPRPSIVSHCPSIPSSISPPKSLEFTSRTVCGMCSLHHARKCYRSRHPRLGR